MMKVIRILTVGMLAAPLPGQELTEQTFEKWYSYIMPREKELSWQRIAWRPTLWEAVLEGQRTDTPILFWAMNGHPLGCT